MELIPQTGVGKKVCIVGASGKLGRYMVKHALDRGYEVVGVCREKSVHKLAEYADRITVHGAFTNDRAVIERAVAGCDAVLTVLVPWGVHDYASGTAKAVMDFAKPDARLIFSCGWHITRDGGDRYKRGIRAAVAFAKFMKITRLVDIADQYRATDAIFSSDTRWTVVRGSDLEEGPSEGLPVWSRHVGDPVLESNLTRRTDFALFMVAAIEDDSLIGEAPAINGRLTPSAIAHAEGAV
ncbi:hypothetical protein GCM10009853_058160 [Glycomyces scopariae]